MVDLAASTAVNLYFVNSPGHQISHLRPGGSKPDDIPHVAEVDILLTPIADNRLIGSHGLFAKRNLSERTENEEIMNEESTPHIISVIPVPPNSMTSEIKQKQ